MNGATGTHAACLDVYRAAGRGNLARRGGGMRRMRQLCSFWALAWAWCGRPVGMRRGAGATRDGQSHTLEVPRKAEMDFKNRSKMQCGLPVPKTSSAFGRRNTQCQRRRKDLGPRPERECTGLFGFEGRADLIRAPLLCMQEHERWCDEALDDPCQCHAERERSRFLHDEVPVQSPASTRTNTPTAHSRHEETGGGRGCTRCPCTLFTATCAPANPTIHLLREPHGLAVGL